MLTIVHLSILAYTYTLVAGMPPCYNAAHKDNSTILLGGQGHSSIPDLCHATASAVQRTAYIEQCTTCRNAELYSCVICLHRDVTAATHDVQIDYLNASDEEVYNVKHPLLDKVRRCSAEPEKAAEFFGALLWPGDDRFSAREAQGRLTYLHVLRQDLIKYRKLNPFTTRRPLCSSHSDACCLSYCFPLQVVAPCLASVTPLHVVFVVPSLALLLPSLPHI